MAEDKQYGSGSIVDIDRLTKLKAKVKAECLRRKYTGSVENYGSSTYDFSNNPTVGGVIRREYYDKNATPLNAINNSLVPKANITDAENVALNNEIYNMDYQVSAWMTTDKTNKNHSDCAVSCTGLCLSCTGSCTSGCSNTCRANCANDCTGTCGDGCTNSCRGCGSGCSGSCYGDCDGGCKGTCTVTCGYNGCVGNCYSSCSDGCSGDGTAASNPGCRSCGVGSCDGACTAGNASSLVGSGTPWTGSGSGSSSSNT